MENKEKVNLNNNQKEYIGKIKNLIYPVKEQIEWQIFKRSKFTGFYDMDNKKLYIGDKIQFQDKENNIYTQIIMLGDVEKWKGKCNVDFNKKNDNPCINSSIYLNEDDYRSYHSTGQMTIINFKIMKLKKI
jgi:phosphatidylserine decarboxylase